MSIFVALYGLKEEKSKVIKIIRVRKSIISLRRNFKIKN